MKILIIISLSVFSLSSFSAVDKLNFEEPSLPVKQVTMRKLIQTNLIRLYIKLPSERRMIAGYKETKLNPTNSI